MKQGIEGGTQTGMLYSDKWKNIKQIGRCTKREKYKTILKTGGCKKENIQTRMQILRNKRYEHNEILRFKAAQQEKTTEEKDKG